MFASRAQIKYPAAVIFHELVSLELYTGQGWKNLLRLMLDSSPKLQILKLTDVSRTISLAFFFF